MDLTNQQLSQLNNYIISCGIQFYDVRAEIVDHFASILERKLDKYPDLDFKKEISTIHKNFSDRGFQKLLEEKTKAVQKKFYKDSFKHFKSFFKLPKIIISGATFYFLFQVMILLEDKRVFFSILTGIGFAFVVVLLLSLYINKKRKKKQFLSLNMNNNFIQIVNLSTVYFNSITNFRTENSFVNPVHNNIQLVVFVVLLFFFWSAQTVFYQNKKMVQKQYPNLLV